MGANGLLLGAYSETMARQLEIKNSRLAAAPIRVRATEPLGSALLIVSLILATLTMRRHV